MRGRLEGEVKGLRDAAFRLLTQRFGTPSEKIRQRLAQTTSPKDLLQLIDNVLDAGSPDELGLA